MLSIKTQLCSRKPSLKKGSIRVGNTQEIVNTSFLASTYGLSFSPIKYTLTQLVAHIGLVTAFLKVATRVYYLPGVDGICSSAYQPKGTCKETVTKRLGVVPQVTERISLLLLEGLHGESQIGRRHAIQWVT